MNDLRLGMDCFLFISITYFSMTFLRSLIGSPLFLTIVLTGAVALYALGLPLASQANDPVGSCASKPGCTAETCDSKGECARTGCRCGCQR
jgi:hypothetical protein